MNVTVIVPSLDPDEKLMQVVEGLRNIGFKDILLVNDGSHADRTEPFREAAQYPEVTVLTHEVNKGKGRALKTAFAWCLENRPDIDGVVTADGDNQHRAEDILKCAEKLVEDPSKLWLGVRDFSLEHVPLRSRFGNTITRFIMRLCGVDVQDTQTGLRAVPASMLPLMCEIDGERYEYETEMLLAMRENKLSIGQVIIETVYIDENQTSHFNTLRDSWKIYKIIFRHMFRRFRYFLKFSASAITCFLLETGIFTVLNLWVFGSLANGPRELAAGLGARCLSAVANFTLNRQVVFKCEGKLSRSVGRYALLALVQGSLSALTIALIQRVTGATNAMETLIKMPVDLLLFLLSFQVQKRWVFKNEE